MNIAIPTYNRPDNFKTIAFLKQNDIPTEWVTIFVANEEERKRYEAFNEYKIVVGHLGICNQRNFITDYYDEGDIIVSMDDDIETIRHKDNLPLSVWLQVCIEHMKNSRIGLLTVSPSSNPYFFEQRIKTSTPSFKHGGYLAVGVFHIYVNHKAFKMDVDVVEDYDRSVMYIKHYGKSIRYFDVYLKTKYWAKGGLAQKRTKDYYLENVNKLLAKYPHHLSSNQKLIRHLDKIHPLPNVVFSLLKNRKTKMMSSIESLPEKDTEIIVGDAFDKTIFDSLYAMLNNLKFDRKIDRCNRRNFPPHYAVTFGIVRDRYKGKVGNSAVTERNPKVFEELKRIASIIRPDFTFTSIHINRTLPVLVTKMKRMSANLCLKVSAIMRAVSW